MKEKNIFNRVLSNSLYLFIIQGVNYLVPLLLLTYLIKNLGQEGFGKYSFLLTIVIYMQTIVDYGFLLTASRDVAKIGDNKIKLSAVFWSVNFSKILVAVFLFIISIFVYFSGYVEISFNFFLYIYFLAFFNSMTPIWYFHGKEDFKVVAIFNILSKGVSCVLIILLVNGPEDVEKIFLANLIPSFLVCVVSFYFIYKKKEIVKTNVRFKDVKDQLVSGWHIFTTSFLSALLGNGCVFWLGIVSNPSIVGAYAMVESIVKAAVSLFQPLTRASYPVIANEFSHSNQRGFRLAFKVGKWLFLLSILCALSLVIFVPFAINILNKSIISKLLVFILSLWLIGGVINNILGIQILTAMGEVKKYSYSFYLSALIFVLLLLTLTHYYYEVGAALALVIAELILTGLLVYKVKKIYSDSLFNSK
ncbi:oligosaccharide flippase family protein [Alcaligenes sp. SDU_A2]|uniref:oligosaccharide flippase family protein n=1 Tax=Alcaligenes sp. SDU_A2 TaxID=3136634 RepID=UPI00311DEB87